MTNLEQNNWYTLYTHDFTCDMCGDERSERLEVHHVIHRSQGGKDTPENLAVLCRHCHELVHDNNPVTEEQELLLEYYYDRYAVQLYGLDTD